MQIDHGLWVRGNFFVFCIEYQQWYQSRSMDSCTIRLERIVDAGIYFLIVTLLLHLFMSVALLDCKRPVTDLTRNPT
jgi:hypothetical protein